MKLITRIITLLIAGLLIAGSDLAAQTQRPIDYAAIAEKIVERLALQPGERVLLVAHPVTFHELVPHLRLEVVRAGGVDLGAIDVLRGIGSSNRADAGDAELLVSSGAASREAYRAMFRDVDASVMMPGAGAGDQAYAAIQDLLREGRGRTIHFHWSSLDQNSVFAIPGQPLPNQSAVDATYQRALLETDYEAIAHIQRRFEEAMRETEVRVTSPLGTDLSFRIGSRPVNRQDGDASAARAGRANTILDREIELPAGAVRVAPLEATVNGTIAFPPSQWDGRPVAGLKLRFEEGRVVEVAAESGSEFVEAEMSRGGEAARRFREFALGFNPQLAVPERGPWIPYYGYGAGVVRLSLGDNTELGGAVSGGYVRWNFFVDATVTVGDVVWVRDGKLIEE